MNRQIGDRAVVLGASLAGLLAARVLADSYGQVTVLDRDELPQASTHRRGVPHGRHVHALLRAGSKPWRSCSPGSPRNWSPTGRRPGTC
jgi:flavin-dependent dehydrogenase